MASGYRNSAGVDFDDLFEPGALAVTGYRRANGAALTYAARTAPAGPNVNYRNAAGTDLSQIWQRKGAAPPVPGFNGQVFGGSATAPTGATGTTSARVTLTLEASGTWTAVLTRSGAGGSPTVTLGSGTWLPTGEAASAFEVQFATTSAGTVSVENNATTFQPLTAGRSVAAYNSINSATLGQVSGQITVTATLRRIAGGASVAICTLAVESQGQV